MNQPQMAVARVESGAVGRAMTVDELHKHLEFVREVMRKEMKEGVDYGNIPGTSKDKKTLLQPGAQKLMMTFNLTVEVKKETLREFPSMPMHREYEFTIMVKAQNGKAWDGVGTCSTLESKYRYRKAERKCPKCGKESVIAGKEEFGGGWLCWKKKDGCGAKFDENDPAITRQAGGAVENEDPADTWNTVRKMAFKRGLVAAAINATNTSELWTQDMEEIQQNEAMQKEKARAQRQPPPATPRQQPTQAPTAAAKTPPPAAAPAKPAATAPRFATKATLAWMITNLHAKPGEEPRNIVTEFFNALGGLLPGTEQLEDLDLRFVPTTPAQLRALGAAIAAFGQGDEAKLPYPLVEPPLPPRSTPKQTEAPKATEPPSKPPLPPTVDAAKQKGPDWFWTIFCPIPRKGMTKQEYDLHPDSILSLYTAMKSGEEAAGKRLWGFAKNWTPEPHEFKGKLYQPSDKELVFREALDAFCDWEEKHGRDTKGQPEAPQSEPEPPTTPEEEEIPF